MSWLCIYIYGCSSGCKYKKGGLEVKGSRERKEACGWMEAKKLCGIKKRVALHEGVLGSGGGRIRPGEIPIVISRIKLATNTAQQAHKVGPQYASRTLLASR